VINASGAAAGHGPRAALRADQRHLGRSRDRPIQPRRIFPRGARDGVLSSPAGYFLEDDEGHVTVFPSLELIEQWLRAGEEE
jgi:hypothetical protein